MRVSFDIDNTNRKNIALLLRERNIAVSLPCGGTGRCLGCKVKVMSDDESLNGTVLACKCIPKAAFTVELDSEEGMYIPADEGQLPSKHVIGIAAIDLGTTTVTVSIIDEKSGETVESISFVNPERSFGADLISRIKSSNDGNLVEMSSRIRNSIKEFIDKYSVSRAVISGNTTMNHILNGISCEDLGIAPFVTSIKDFIVSDLVCDETICMPPVSAFIGGDIVSGIYALDMDKDSDINILIDLGTNGELVIGNKDGFIATSTSAGPAFEGGELNSGVASIPGAISSVNIINGFARVKTIGNLPAIGVCGTGAIETVSELLKNHIIDANGTLSAEFIDEGYPLVMRSHADKLLFTQEDIRAVQMAKAAICSGIEIMTSLYGCDYNNIKNVYVAGGFGVTMDVTKATAIGLIPKELEAKIIPVGNSSLKGAKKFALNTDFDRIRDILNKIKEKNLASNESFEARFIDNLNFKN